jgi:hypothetical protein
MTNLKVSYLRNPYFGNMKAPAPNAAGQPAVSQWQPKFMYPSQGGKVDKTNTAQHYSDMH